MDEKYIVEKALLESKYYKRGKTSQISLRLPEGLKEEYRTVFGNRRLGELLTAVLIDELAKHYALTNK